MQRNNAGILRWPQRPNEKRIVVIFYLLLVLFVGLLASVYWFDASSISSAGRISIYTKPEFPLECAVAGNQSCPAGYPTTFTPTNPDRSSDTTCQSYFRWIHEDLRPWRKTGITRETIEEAGRTAQFRLVIVNGKAYVERYRPSYQTRDLFTLWGILQLLRLYPGKVPDLDLVFNCEDRPVIQSNYFQGPNASPPPLFSYCADNSTLDIVFPDWSFWGWIETNIKPWESVWKDIKEGSKRTLWKDRVPYAYWKGNPYVSPARYDLMKCNVSDKNDWNARLYTQDWEQETLQGFERSKLEDQCTHRYKIYVEGIGWSVSEKYILACDSMTLYVNPRFHDFYIRGMMPLQHFWPVSADKMCTSLKFAVEWGNTHPEQAKAIGEAAVSFIEKELKMGCVYDYMFHLLNEYAKLLTFKPTVPRGAVEICSEAMACPAMGTWKKFMEESMVLSPSESDPCILPPPYDPRSLQNVLERKADAVKQVETWENEYWGNEPK